MEPAFIRAWLAQNIAEASRLVGASVPPLPEGVIHVLELRLKQLEEDASLQPWLLRAIRLKATGEMIGHIGFHTAPGPAYLDDWLAGAVEFGFQVYDPHRRRGYALEASQALMDWARGHGVTQFVLTISPDNHASQALARRLGFARIGQHMDEHDGIEDVLAHTEAITGAGGG